MNADILNRMMRAIANGSQGDLERLAQAVVESERQVGHNKFADQLTAILARPRPATKSANENQSALAELNSPTPKCGRFLPIRPPSSTGPTG